MSSMRFNTASGMRSHVTARDEDLGEHHEYEFQYRKRYEVTCDIIIGCGTAAMMNGFNTASGMRSHVTWGGCA